MDTFYWKTKNFRNDWSIDKTKIKYTDKDNNIYIDLKRISDFIEIKYDDDKLYYNLKRLSNMYGIDDVSEIINSTNKNIYLCILEDLYGFVLAEFEPKSFESSLRYLKAKDPNYNFLNEEGKGYVARGDIHISKKSFKKIHSISFIYYDY